MKRKKHPKSQIGNKLALQSKLESLIPGCTTGGGLAIQPGGVFEAPVFGFWYWGQYGDAPCALQGDVERILIYSDSTAELCFSIRDPGPFTGRILLSENQARQIAAKGEYALLCRPDPEQSQSTTKGDKFLPFVVDWLPSTRAC